MSWVYFTDDSGQNWMVNQIGLYMMIREYLHESMLHQRAKVVREKKWIGPDLVTVEINFDGLRAKKDTEAPEIYNDMANRMLHSAEESFNKLVEVRQITKMHSDALHKMQSDASKETMGNIDKSVNRGEIGLKAATVVRDLSATTLVVGATFLSGGAALAVLGGGSALKGTATYQDTGNVGAAILDGTITFVVGGIGVGAAANPATANAASLSTRWAQASAGGVKQAIVDNAKDKGLIVLIGASFNATGEALKGHMTGKTGKDSLRMAAARFGTDVAGGLLAGPLLDHLALPIIVRTVTDTVIATGSDKLVGAAEVQQAVAKAPEKTVALFDAATNGSSDGDYIRKNILRRV